MKSQITVCVICSLFSFSSFAQSPYTAENIPLLNPYNGLQFGVGVPLVTPLTSINGFVGYINKDASGFWAKRFGVRADFAFSNPLRFHGKVDGDDIVINARALGFKHGIRLEDVISPISISSAAGPIDVELDGTKAALMLKNRYLGGLIDFYPFGDAWFFGGIRLSGGYYVGKMDLDVTAYSINNLPTPDGFVYAVNSGTNVIAMLPAGTKTSASVHWNYNGPYAGLGFDIGVFRGFKLYLDAGVVFAKAPQLHDNNLYIPERSVQACIEVNGVCDQWGYIDIRDPHMARDALLSQLISGLLSNPVYNGVDYSAVVSQIPSDVFDAVIGWLGSGNPAANRPTWVDNLISGGIGAGIGIEDIVNQIEIAASGYAAAFDMEGVTAEYLRTRADFVDNANSIMKDLRFVPMVRLGVMYRF